MSACIIIITIERVKAIEDRKPTISQCQCSACQQPSDHPDKLIHRRLNEFISHLDERQKRWFVALESQKIGYGGDKLISEITGIAEKTIRKGREEVEQGLSEYPVEKKRVKGGGRPLTEKKISPD